MCLFTGVLTLVGCIMTEANFGPNTGYSCILSTIAGGFSIIFVSIKSKRN